MNKILLVGNGFDLAHGLLTSYGDFLYLMKNWDFFILAYNKKNRDGIFEKYLANADNFENKKIEELGKIIKENSWLRYFCNCEAEIDGWIDFEKEIYPVMQLFEFIFQSNYSDRGNSSVSNVYIDALNLSSRLRSVCKLWDTYIVYDRNRIWIQEKFISKQYGILKKKIMKSLKEEFE